jgi:anti-sigma factor RsiW
VVDWAGVAAHVDDELVDDDEDVVAAEAVLEAACAASMAMPDPSPRNAVTLIAPAISRDRAAAWCRFVRPRAGTGRARGSLLDRSVVSIMSSVLSWTQRHEAWGPMLGFDSRATGNLL